MNSYRPIKEERIMSEQKFKAYRYYEGICSSKDFIKELSKALSIGVRSNEVKDSEGNVLLEPFILKSKNWDIVYPAPDSTLSIDTMNMTDEDYRAKINNQVNQISDTVILKTTTTPIDLSNTTDDIAIDNDRYKESLTMYLEIYKPTYVANPEIYPLDCERHGVIPKVITKGMYEDSFKIKKRVEEIVTLATNDCCTINETTTVNNGIKEYNSYSECSLVVSKIINAYGGDAGAAGFYMPQIAGMGTADLELNKSEILGIKSKDNDLYNIIRDILNIDDNTYRLLTVLKFNVNCVNPNEYYLSIESETVKSIYTVAKDGSYQVQKAEKDDVIITNIIPEYFIDGVYIPVDRNLWEYDATVLNNRGIVFKESITGDVAKNGNIVIRYDIAVPEDENVSERGFILNNHYCLMRLFDELNDEGNGPSETSYDENGAVIVQRAHVSDWTKLSWYKDFEEIYRDDIDSDVSTTNITDGTLLVPLETAGLNGETKIRYWLNTNNDRFDLIVMGNPSLDYSRERHIISACYCGRIDSFDESVADVAGNFALFTSSSTEPCKTTMTTEKEYLAITYDDAIYDTSDPNYVDFLEKAYKTPCIDGYTEYYIQLPEGRYFNQEEWPKYMVIDESGEAVSHLQTVYRISYITNNEAKITIHSSFDSTHQLVVGYPYYTEKIVLTSGVQRDLFGNVESVKKTDTYGLNTSDGTTSVMMYHTQSKAYYQKHQFMFTTTEEYMSKIMYGKSQYTGEYYADRIKITHGNDGPRGMLNDILVIDSSSLYPFDELVINKDFEKDPNAYEETYVYFPISAPFSPLSDSPNARYGLAIKQKEVEPDWKDEHVKVDMAIQELGLIVNEAWWGITSDIFPIGVTSNGCSVLWETVPNSMWYETEQNSTDYTPIDLCLTLTGYHGDQDVTLVAETIDSESVTQSTDPKYKGSKLISKVNFDATSFTIDTEADAIYYGVSDTIPVVKKDDTIKVTIEPENNTGTYTHDDYVYPIKDFLYSGIVEDIEATAEEITLKDAMPGKYLVVYGVKENTERAIIKNYGVVQLTHDMIKYPCQVSTLIASGSGVLDSESIRVIDYDSDMDIQFTPDIGWYVGKVIVEDSDGVKTEFSASDLTKVNSAYTLKLEGIKRDTTVTINLTTTKQ
jgi:hypothetical protein